MSSSIPKGTDTPINNVIKSLLIGFVGGWIIGYLPDSGISFDGLGYYLRNTPAWSVVSGIIITGLLLLKHNVKAWESTIQNAIKAVSIGLTISIVVGIFGEVRWQYINTNSDELIEFLYCIKSSWFLVSMPITSGILFLWFNTKAEEK